MSLPKKDLDNLKNFIKENNFTNNNSVENLKETNNLIKVDNPSENFYSIIDNSENINETSKEKLLLKKSEDSFYKINSCKANYSNNLSIEDELYEEFNYLLDE